MEFLKDLWNFLIERKNYWLMPVLIVIVLLGLILIFSQTPAGPFIYTIF